MSARRSALVLLGVVVAWLSLVAASCGPPPTASGPRLGHAGPDGSALPARDAGTDADAAAVPRAVKEPPTDDGLVDPRFAAVDAAIASAVAAGKLPGCVLLVGRHDEVLLRRAYGHRSLLPERTPMTVDTVFDLASLTKPLATATSIMLLVDRGLVDVKAPAAKYVSELARLPAFTVEHLLLHTSGLPAATPIADYALGDRAAIMRKLATSLEGKLKAAPGERFLYTDVGYIVLEEIVRRVSGQDLAAFTTASLWQPLGMTDTGFLPGPALRARAAPTEQREGQWMRGDVHDPRAFALGGVAGHAGLFSTADDLSRYARMMLGRGTFDEQRLLSERVFDLFVARHDTSSGGRTLGWDRDSRFASHRSALLSPKAIGHGGFTGTALWIDPGKDLYVVFLSNRVHPDGKGAVNPLVAEVATLAIDAAETRSGLDMLRASGFEALKGARVGLVTNASAKARDGTTAIDVLRTAPGVTLAALFTPEHGLQGASEGRIGDGSYQGLPVTSLYGERGAPSAASLAGVDTLVVDLQDVGVRFYTYASTMKNVMKVAAERKLRFVVLDRPNPLGGLAVAGPVLGPPYSFVNHHALPVRHGLTMGELARLFAADEHLDLAVQVVALGGWRRKDYFDHTGLVWTPPSPNLRTPEQVVLYPMVGLLEGTNVSVGRGTATPFEVLGAPGLDGEALARALSVPGVRVTPTTFTPTSSVHAGTRCGGIQLRVTDRAAYEPVTAALAIAKALHDASPAWDFEHVGRMLADDTALQALGAGASPIDVARAWEGPLAAFATRRARALIYP